MKKPKSILTLCLIVLTSLHVNSQKNIENHLLKYAELIDERFDNHENDSLSSQLKNKVLDIQKQFYIERNKLIVHLKKNGVKNELMIYKASKNIREKRMVELNKILTKNQISILELEK